MLTLFLAPVFASSLSSVKQSYPLQTMDQVIREIARSKHPQFIAFGTLLQSSCGQDVLSQLQDPNQANTLFLPTDGALLASLNPPIPIRGFSCAENATCQESPLPVSGGYPTNALLPCLPDILRRHLITGLALTVPTNQTVITNSLVVKGDQVRFSAAPPARIVRANISCANGNIQIIDRMMIPPANLTRSLEALNLTMLAQAVRFKGQESTFLNLTQATFIFPIQPGNALNLTGYTIPNQVIWNNRTTSEMQVTSLADTPLRITFGFNKTMRVEGQPVILANIPVANGVLHLIQQIFQ